MRLLLEVVAFALLFAPVLTAQNIYGGIEGRVLDESGAAVKGANVEIRNLSSQQLSSATTGATGAFLVERLTPGEYQLTVSAGSFAPAALAVEVHLGKTVRVAPLLKVSADSQSINVHDTLDASQYDIHETITSAEIFNLPQRTRTLADLAVTAPNIRPQGSFARNKARTVSFSVNGSDGRNAEVNLDGVDNRDYIFGGYLQSLPVDAVQEFKITTANAMAESGRTNGVLIDVVTRMGGKQWHGDLFYMARDNAFSSRNYFQRQDGVPEADSYRHNFGVAGGRNLSENVYFWGSGEYVTEDDPNLVSDAALSELELLPGAVPQRYLPRPYTNLTGSLRFDWLRSEKDHFFLRVSSERNTSRNELMGEPAAADISNGNRTVNRHASAALAWSHIFNPSFVNELRLGFTDSRADITANSTAPNLNFATVSEPGIADTPAVQIGANQNTPGIFYQTRWQVREDMSLTRGRHALNFGISNIYQPRIGGFLLFGSTGHIVTFFDRPSVIMANPGLYPDGLATPGAVREILYSNGDGSFHQSTNLFGVYFNDRIRISPTFTLTAGLRYDYEAGSYPKMERDPAFQLLHAIGHPLGAHNPEAPKNMFAPRVGFAWNPDGVGKRVFSAGYGIFYDSFIQQFALPTLQRQNATVFNTPIDLVNTRTGSIGPADGGDIPGFRYGIDPLPTVPASSELVPNSTVRYLDPEFTNPYVQTWTASYEERFGRDWTAGVDYIHVLGLNEMMSVEANPRPVGGGPRELSAAFDAAGVTRLGSVRAFRSINRSHYDGLTFRMQRAMRKGIFWQASYTLAKATTFGGRYSTSYNFGRSRVSERDDFGPGEFGPTSADERHRFVTCAILQLPYGFEVSPILQASSARPYTVFAGDDLNGDGVFGGSGEEGIFGDRLIVNGGQLPVNSERGDPFLQLDLRASKAFRLGESKTLRIFTDLFNLTNANNFGNNYFVIGEEALLDPQPRGLFGKQGEVGSTVGVPFQMQVGVGFNF